DRPYWQQYLSFLKGIAHGDFGYSFNQNRPVSDIIFPAAVATASVVLGAAVMWMLIAIPIGAYGALHPRSAGDVSGRVFAILGMSIPIFWVAPMLSYILAYQPTQGVLFGMHILPVGTSWFPIDGYVKFTDNPISWAHHLILPWLAFSLTFAAVYARYVRTVTIEQLSDDYVRTARAKGMRTSRLLVRHVGRNVAPVLAVLLGVDIGIALGGTLFVETVFNIPGLGYTGINAIQTLDYPLVTGVITFAAIVAVAANTVVDVVHGLLDPRVRVGASS
ncbi:MAG TPA: ABC transporter permease, partial [Acidimicrobiales bacterium]